MKTQLISLHGGHSGQFCWHAQDSLEDIIRQYIRLGFRQVGITEHIPPASDRFLYPDEIAQGLDAKDLLQQFGRYIKTARALKEKYQGKIQIYVGMETETVTGYKDHIPKLIEQFKPDYLVGSVHHVNDICFDYSNKEYEKATLSCGSIEGLYKAYFDLQYEMIMTIKPFVVGHIDLIRIFDPEFKQRLLHPDLTRKIERNLALIKSLGLVLDFNQRPLARGEKEPYIAPSIMELAKKMDLRLVPGDDSHSAAQAGGHVDTAIALLKKHGFNTHWPEPRLLS